MKNRALAEFLYQLITLMLAFIVVHAVYVAVVRPKGDAVYAAQAARQAAGEPYQVERSVYVIVYNYEQESCFVLALWGLAIIGFKARYAFKERALFRRLELGVAEGTRILPEDSRKFSRVLQELPPGERDGLLPRALLAGLHRFGSTQSVQEVSHAIRDLCETEGARLESDLALLRYIVWAIPALGFIGTVRGIGLALEYAHRAVEGDILGVTISLGLAFNSTLVALMICLVFMFLIYHLQQLQERLVLDAHTHCDVHLVRHLAVR